MKRNFSRRVVVTGIGVVSPLGADRESTWAGVVEGRSGVTPTGARVPLESSALPRTVELALRAAAEAVVQAGEESEFPPSDRRGCCVSSSKPLLGSEGEEFFRPPEDVPFSVARRWGVDGPVLNLASACATGTQSVLTGAGWIQEGSADWVLAGASESSLHPLFQAGFQQMGVLSRQGRVCPFDRARDGFVMGEGAAVFVLEPLDSALQRGALVWGEILGGHFGSDAHHATRFNSNGRTMTRCLQNALDRAGLCPQDLDYVNAHGTGTELNDRLEASALESLFASQTVPISSTKGATGHLLGATGAVELALTLLSLRDGVLPPTINLSEPITDELDFVPGQSRRATVRRAASLSFGFGGTLAAVVVGSL